MNLNITTDKHDSKIHNGELFPEAAKREFVYQNEQGISGHLVIEAHPPFRDGGKKNWNLKHPLYDRYSLKIAHGSNTLHFVLMGHRNDVVEQRRRNGKAVMEDVLTYSMSFGEFCNLIFANGAQVFENKEAFPKSVEAAMMVAYPPSAPDSNVSGQSVGTP